MAQSRGDRSAYLATLSTMPIRFASLLIFAWSWQLTKYSSAVSAMSTAGAQSAAVMVSCPPRGEAILIGRIPTAEHGFDFAKRIPMLSIHLIASILNIGVFFV
jgi:hypothetical protein